MNPNFIPCQFFAIIAYEQLGLEEEIRKKYEILYKLTGDGRNRPAITPWTDEKMIRQQEEAWERIVARYT
jgi:hypothetical protein